jgi:hypothetical protein
MQLNMLVETGAPVFMAKFKCGYFGRHDWKPHGRELDEE